MRVDAFHAMGSDARVYLVGGPASLLATARRRIDDLEARWSRFLPTSEVSHLNALDGACLVASADTFELVRRAVEAWHLTEGRYDPTVLGAVLRAGYTASFDQLGPVVRPVATRLTSGCAEIELDAATRSVRLPAGVGFDPGGIGKGLAADLLVAELLDQGADGACVNLGGDVRVAGVPPAGPWRVAIEHPYRDDPAAMVHLRDGAVATSSQLRRRWETDHGPAHHLIDPRTGRPATSRVLTATAVAAQGWQAEALAKAAFLAGIPDGLGLCQRVGAAALLVDDDGAVLTNRAFTPFADGIPDPQPLADVTT